MFVKVKGIGYINLDFIYYIRFEKNKVFIVTHIVSSIEPEDFDTNIIERGFELTQEDFEDFFKKYLKEENFIIGYKDKDKYLFNKNFISSIYERGDNDYLVFINNSAEEIEIDRIEILGSKQNE